MELQELRALGLGPGAALDDRDLSSNWFSLQSTQRVYNTFSLWDADSSGSLSRAEFSRISQGTMSELFIARVFEEHVAAPRGDVLGAASGEESPGGLPRLGLRVRTRSGSGDGSGGGSGGGDGSPAGAVEGGAARARRRPAPPEGAGPRDEMDMMAFVDFVLAWDHRNHPAALPYFFSIFDLQHKGCLTHSDLYTFFREIHVMWVAMGEYADLAVHDVLDEIVDMAAPARQGAITLKDLRECKMAGTVFSILANVDQFYQENFMHTGEGDGGGEQGQQQAGGG
ncbi:Serine/threonine-protein phosphatase 2Aregulatory subunit B'' subunit gamma [Monoraphidium neglectum]|uniref:Serine/threonine-protein phosphatase 2Aregulatory subunit B'' subunit gamma n=1 Tax=Monoraphidium neglectum TaxID=145388 RepID=A0A0D2KDT4_9CHLO|nr:Serine/threonine-protein phosphatase 2Aregulatory subunit B'' subunit gamma [Monoraphidium neglectum]KIY93993.1 Serine/threonine-protein phosphatase 2Aregulatory subunit B'' subunit gamma [Monoraphidium neglectum]|eukprot:XP_013893013.1 Serine/threonine-protein phosphatase 2Aregulatory subunit B'' subunit gamma [Monoraphidium neglectum]